VAADILFLPGAGASADFWRPVGVRLPATRRKHYLAWPGLGNQPHDPAVRGMDDLVSLVLARIEEPADLIAQSMGGVVALKAALAAPEKVRRMVLVATSGGVPVGDLGGADWRETYRREFPAAAAWITEVQEDLSVRLPTVAIPCLLLWGDADPISPPAVGRRLQALLSRARLHLIRDGSHDLAQTHAAGIVPLVADHLR
jgi:pimeloyl-ACP methyl ester carboxylesterase